VKLGLAARYDDDSDVGTASELALMREFHEIVRRKCSNVYPAGLTEQMVRKYPILGSFVHTTVPEGTLIRVDKNGHKRVKQGKCGVTTEFVCHKQLVHCHLSQQRLHKMRG